MRLLWWLVLWICNPTVAVHVTGRWNTGGKRVEIVTKFGFQQTRVIDRVNSRGYIYGNITSSNYDKNQSPVLFAIVPETQIGALHSESSYAVSCGVLLRNLSTTAFESRCFAQGKADLLRWIPCPAGELCRDEDDASAVLPGFQLTMQIEEPTTPEYWYVVLLGCELDANCTWQHSETVMDVEYDLWLTNGHPAGPTSKFRLQFSFDEQDCAEMYLISLVLYLILCGCLFRAASMSQSQVVPPRTRLLSWIVGMKTAGLTLQCLNVLQYAVDGEGVGAARVLGEMMRIAAVALLCLLLILLSSGWALSGRERISKTLLVTWAVLSIAHYVFFFFNSVFIYDTLHDVDVFTSWPGYCMLSIRILFALWFLVQVRMLIQREQCEEKAVFIAHVGAGFLVWFVYLPGLGVIASFISTLWRFKIILAITTMANYVAICCLLHLFWPTSTNRKYFQSDYNFHRRMGRSESNEMQDYERLLLEGSDGEETIRSRKVIRYNRGCNSCLFLFYSHIIPLFHASILRH